MAGQVDELESCDGGVEHERIAELIANLFLESGILQIQLLQTKRN